MGSRILLKFYSTKFIQGTFTYLCPIQLGKLSVDVTFKPVGFQNVKEGVSLSERGAKLF